MTQTIRATLQTNIDAGVDNVGVGGINLKAITGVQLNTILEDIVDSNLNVLSDVVSQVDAEAGPL